CLCRDLEARSRVESVSGLYICVPPLYLRAALSLFCLIIFAHGYIFKLESLSFDSNCLFVETPALASLDLLTSICVFFLNFPVLHVYFILFSETHQSNPAIQIMFEISLVFKWQLHEDDISALFLLHFF
ncbi:hypothetical protein ACJX0J_039489, partial [Zea mays]